MWSRMRGTAAEVVQSSDRQRTGAAGEGRAGCVAFRFGHAGPASQPQLTKFAPELAGRLPIVQELRPSLGVEPRVISKTTRR